MAKFSRPHYIKIAACIARVRANYKPNGNVRPALPFDKLVDELCKLFYEDNRAFDPAQFRQNCKGDK
jgi:hypothetical protein